MITFPWSRSLTLPAAFAFFLSVGAGEAFATAIPISDGGVLQIGSITGSQLGITGAIFGQGVPFCLNWGGAGTCVAGTTHQMSVGGVSSIFSTATSATDRIQDVGSAPPPTLVDFETVLGAGAEAGNTIHFDLVSVIVNGATPVGNCLSNAPNNSCTPADSPFTLMMDNTATQLTVSFSALLNAYTGNSATGFTPYKATFSFQDAGVLMGMGACNGIATNITNFVFCEEAGGTVTSNWAATETPLPVSSVPEPGAFALVSGALAAVMLRRLQRS